MVHGLFALIFTLTFAPAAKAVFPADDCVQTLGIQPVSAEAMKNRIIADLGRLALQPEFTASRTAVQLAARLASGQWNLYMQKAGDVPQPGTLTLLSPARSAVILTEEGLRTLQEIRRIEPAIDLPVMVLTAPEKERGKAHWPLYGQWLLSLAQLCARLQAVEAAPQAPLIDGLEAELRAGMALSAAWGLPSPPSLEHAIRMRISAPLAEAFDKEDYARLAQYFASTKARGLESQARTLDPLQRPRFFNAQLALQTGKTSSLAYALAEPGNDERFIALLKELGSRAALVAAMQNTIPGSPLIAEGVKALGVVQTALLLSF